MFFFNLCCTDQIELVDQSTSPINFKPEKTYLEMNDSFNDIINNIENNASKIIENCINCNSNCNNNIEDLFKDYNNLELKYNNLEQQIIEKDDYILNLENKIKYEINKVIKTKKCYLNCNCNHVNCDITFYKNKINDQEKQINFYKTDYETILNTNKKNKLIIEETKKNINIKMSKIENFEIKYEYFKLEIENLHKLNNKLKDLNNMLNNENKQLINENNEHNFKNEYLTELNKRLKKKYCKKIDLKF